jgi:hypothetical protein
MDRSAKGAALVMQGAFMLSTMFALPSWGGVAAADPELYSGLLSWAEKLSGYPRPQVEPTVEFVPQAFFNKHACNDRPCRVWGWYPNTGGNVVYVHEAARDMIGDGSDPRGLLAASIVVHEFTHYLQAVHRGFAPYECEDALALEHQAYAVQNAFIVAYGRLEPVGVSMHTARCAGNAGDNPAP